MAVTRLLFGPGCVCNLVPFLSNATAAHAPFLLSLDCNQRASTYYITCWWSRFFFCRSCSGFYYFLLYLRLIPTRSIFYRNLVLDRLAYPSTFSCVPRLLFLARSLTFLSSFSPLSPPRPPAPRLLQGTSELSMAIFQRRIARPLCHGAIAVTFDYTRIMSS